MWLRGCGSIGTNYSGGKEESLFLKGEKERKKERKKKKKALEEFLWSSTNREKSRLELGSQKWRHEVASFFLFFIVTPREILVFFFCRLQAHTFSHTFVV